MSPPRASQMTERCKALPRWSLAICLVLAGCGSLPEQSPPVPAEPEAAEPATPAVTQATPDAAPEPPPRPFTEAALYELLLGEFAYQNRSMTLAIEKYIEQALATKDSGVASHATWLAHYSRNPAAATTAAAIWYETAPEDPRSGGVFADLLAQAGRAGNALDILIAQYQRAQQPDYRLLQRTPFNDQAAPADQLQTIIERLGAQLPLEPENVGLVQTYASLLQQAGEYQRALDAMQTPVIQRAGGVQNVLMEAQLLDALGQTEAAVDLLADAHRKDDDESMLHWHYARLLAQTDLPRAEREFEKLLAMEPDSVDMLYFHGLVAFQNKHYDASRNSFEKLTRYPERSNVAHYFLAEIAKQQERLPDAVDHYRAVEGGKHFLPATQALVDLLADRGELEDARTYLHSLRLLKPLQEPNFWAMEAKLLARNEQPETAMQVLDTAINRFGKQTMLRLERAMLAESMGQLDIAESDLRTVLEAEPDNYIALNTLGYTLANRTTRFDEALALLERAIALAPDDAAVIDSLGWAQFKLGQYDAARENLERAFEKYPVDEVAAHLVELYWTQGERRKLRKLVKQMRSDGAATPLIDATCTRLGIDCPE